MSEEQRPKFTIDDLLEQRKAARNSGNNLVVFRQDIRAGERDDALYRWACKLRSVNVAKDFALTMMKEQWKAIEQPPNNFYSLNEAESKVHRVYEEMPQGVTMGDYLASLLDRTGLAPEVEKTALLDAQVEAAVQRIEIQDRAKEVIAQRKAELVPLPTTTSLTALLNEPDEDSSELIEGWWPQEGSVLLAAPNKAGKSTLVGNLIRSLADGEPFLDKFLVSEPQRVVLLDVELSRRMSKTWLRDQNIANKSNVNYINLRGLATRFNIHTEQGVKDWAELLQGNDVLILDPAAPVMSALGLDHLDNASVQRFLAGIDAVAVMAGIANVFVVTHMGHNNERARGASAWDGWPDAVWRLVTDKDNTFDGPRYLKAFGRDIDQPEQRLEFDPVNRHLSLVGGTRKDSVKRVNAAELLENLRIEPGDYCFSANDIEQKFSRKMRDALPLLVESGDVVDTGQYRKKWTLNPNLATSPKPRQRELQNFATSPLEGRG
jgi:hypothetical protein